MILDAHTHLFPSAVLDRRAEFLAADPAFASLYATPRARLATAGDLIGSMDEAGIDVSVAMGFAWCDAGRCAIGNDATLDAGARNGGRILPFATVWPLDPDAAYREAQRCAAAGARGLGELRPGVAGGPQYTLASPAGDALAAAARDFDLTLAFHVGEPVGHSYAGKEGFTPAEVLAFAERNRGLRLIAAHWGGGLPFYALMPEIHEALATTWFDTAATSLLYRDDIFALGTALTGVEHILFGSDYPLLSQRRQRRLVEGAPGLTPETRIALLGGNAARLFRLGE